MLFIVGLILLVLAQHPFITYPLSLVVGRKLLPSPLRADNPISELPFISVLCCCHNEASVIEAKVDNLLTAAKYYGGKVEILFFLDDCSDETAAILEKFGDKVSVVLSEGRTGKSVGMRLLVGRSAGAILAFTDANTFLEQNAFVEVANAFRRTEIGGVSAQLFYTNAHDTVTTQLNSVYWRLEEGIKRLESETGSIMGADGAFFAIRRQFYIPTPPDIIDDFHTSLNVVLSGSRLVSVPAIRAFEKTSTKSEDEFRRKIRITCRAFNCYRLLMPRLHKSPLGILYKFYSHKVLRWLSFTLSAAGMLFVLAGLMAAGDYRTSAVLVVLAVVSLSLGKLNIRPFGQIYEFAISLLAASLGVLQSLRGRRYQTWTIAASGR